MKSAPILTIRRATSADVPALVGLMRAFYAESSYVLDEPRAARIFMELLSRPDRGAAWLALSGDHHAGYVVLTLRYSMDHGAMDGHVDDLYVSPQFRRQGIGSARLSALLDERDRESLGSLHVEVAGADLAANALYGKFGFQAPSDGRVLLHRESETSHERSTR